MSIAVLISGGVDSAVAVRRLLDQGQELHLFYIRIGRDDKLDGSDCSAEEDIEMCRFIARKYALPFEIVTLHEEYWAHVMAYALRTVKAGLTPHPDMMCNKMIKFGFFEERWGHEFDKTATGHYARTVIGDDGLVYLATGVDAVKDQTDFLSQISYQQLEHALFPIGDLPKSRVRELAEEANLPNARRRDSQGICFLGKINYNDFLRDHLGTLPGPIVDIESGKTLGEHNGYWFHTIGQRKGLGLSGGPWFVVGKDVERNTLYVSRGYDTELQYGRELSLSEMHWITRDPWPQECTGREIAFKNRHTPEFTPGLLTRTAPGRYTIESAEKIQGIAPGQFATIYTPDRRLCLGSGLITLSPKLT